MVIVMILWLVDLAKWIKYNWLLQLSDYSQLSDNIVRLQLYRTIGENKAANAPIKFEEL